MKETIKIKDSKFYLMFFVYCVIITACILAGIRMYKLSIESLTNPDIDSGWFFFIPLAVILVEFTVILLQWISKRVKDNRLFDITEDGIEQVYTLVFFMIFFLMPTAKLLPWECIKEFKIATWTGGRKYVVAEIRKDKLPKNISPLFKMAILTNHEGPMNGLYFGSRNADISADELLKILKKYHKKYQDK